MSALGPELLAPLPQGERVLWRGTPRWQSLAARAFHVHRVAAYFGVLVLLRCAFTMMDGGMLLDGLVAGLSLATLGALAVAMLTLLGWLTARTTTYVLTSERLVMRFGVSLPMMVSVPLRLVESAALHSSRDGTGDLVLALRAGSRIGFVPLWPHVRPWHWSRPQPMLRAIESPQRVAALFAEALAAGTALDVSDTAPPASRPPMPVPPLAQAA